MLLGRILSRVPQGSILSFNIFMCDMFLILKAIYFAGYADDNTPFAVRDNIADVTKALEEIRKVLLNWFLNIRIKTNASVSIPWVYSVFSGTESLKFFGPKVWALLPDEIKQLESLG